MSKYGVFSGPYFPAFGLNTERYEVSYLDTFHAVVIYHLCFLIQKSEFKKIVYLSNSWGTNRFLLVFQNFWIDQILYKYLPQYINMESWRSVSLSSFHKVLKNRSCRGYTNKENDTLKGWPTEVCYGALLLRWAMVCY